MAPVEYDLVIDRGPSSSQRGFGEIRLLLALPLVKEERRPRHWNLIKQTLPRKGLFYSKQLAEA